jgi:hypothetical protein
LLTYDLTITNKLKVQIGFGILEGDEQTERYTAVHAKPLSIKL